MAYLLFSISAPRLIGVTLSNLRDPGTANVLNIIDRRREYFPELKTLAVIHDMAPGVDIVDDVLSAVPKFISHLALFQDDAVDLGDSMAQPNPSGEWLCSGVSSLSITWTLDVTTIRKMVEARFVAANDRLSLTAPSAIRKLRITGLIPSDDPDLVWLKSHVDEVECDDVGLYALRRNPLFFLIFVFAHLSQDFDPYVMSVMFDSRFEREASLD